ncbi:MAG: glycosyltransferase [Synergistaceae bacterium]|nr:glycosyltransferase [Synergistaceae bacterium]
MYEFVLWLLKPVLEPFVSGDVWPLIMRFMPFIIFYELPYTLLIYLGVTKYIFERSREGVRRAYFPPVSCVITCYSEGRDVQGTIRTLAEQIYPGRIQIIAMVDGAARNRETYEAALAMKGYVSGLAARVLEVVPKWQRGGRVSNINTGLNYMKGDIIFVLDGDTSFDNNMVERAVRHFEDPTVAAVSGCLRVRNADSSLAASLQAVEYFISIQTSKTGLSEFNLVNNVSGAFGIFRRSVVELVRGWDAGTAEDLDMTLRIKQYFGRYGERFRIIFDPETMGHTDVPDTFLGYFRQRIRWDGDLSFIYFRKHRRAFSPRLLGWSNFIMVILSGLYSQIVLPFVIFTYSLWLFWAYPLGYVASLLFAVYLFYFILLSATYITSLLFISERKKEELSRLPLLAIFPLFTFASRINSLIATIYELAFRSHKDSSMAPWWVTKKSKFD